MKKPEEAKAEAPTAAEIKALTDAAYGRGLADGRAEASSTLDVAIDPHVVNMRLEALKMALTAGGSDTIVREKAESYFAFLKGDPLPVAEEP